MRCVSDGQLERGRYNELLKMVIDQSTEILRLRAAVRDVFPLSAIPEAWGGENRTPLPASSPIC
jgi:hypothetical protein